MKKFLIIGLLCLFSCSSSDQDLKRFLTGQGYSSIIIRKDYPWFACAKGQVGTKFTATNKFGAKIDGCICETIGHTKTISIY